MAAAWGLKDAGVASLLEDRDVAALRATSKEWKAAVDATLTRLRPVSLPCPHLTRLLPGLQSLLLDHPKLTIDCAALKECGALTQLTQLHLGGPACLQLRNHHLSWVSKLTRLQDLRLRGCTKVRLNVVASWHTLTQLQSLSLIGLGFVATDAPHLAAFLAAGSAASLTSLLLGDQQGLSFLSDAALEGLGQLLSPSCRLKVLDLSGGIELTDAGMQHLKGLGASLHTLQLHNCMKLGTGTCSIISSCFSHLTALNLRGCCQLGDASLAALLQGPVCSRLKVLNLQSCTGLTGAVFPAAASKLVLLQELNLAYCGSLVQQHLSALQHMPALQQLSLAGCSAVCGPEVLLMLGRIKGLTQLDGSGWTLRGHPPAAAAIAAAAAAEAVETGSNASTDTEVVSSASSSARSSSSADTVGTAEDGSSASSSAAVPTDTQCCDSGASSDLLLPPGLHSLKLSNLNCSEPMLQVLVAQLPNTLTSLDLSNCRVAGVGVQGTCLSGLQHLANLQVLDLSGTTGGLFAPDLAFLQDLSRLTKLQVDHVHSRPVQAVPEAVSLLPWQAWMAAATTAAVEPAQAAGGAAAALEARAAEALGASAPDSGASSSDSSSSSSSSLQPCSNSSATGSNNSSSSESSAVRADSPAVSGSTLLEDSSQSLQPQLPPQQQQQQQPLPQQQQQQQLLPQMPERSNPMGVAALLLGSPYAHNLYAGSQASSSVSETAGGFVFPALESLQLTDSTAPVSPRESQSGPAAEPAAEAAAGAAAAATAGSAGIAAVEAGATVGAVLQDADGSRRRSSLSCGRTVCRTLFAAECGAGQVHVQDAAATAQADAKRFRAPLPQELDSQQQQQLSCQKQQGCVTASPSPWLLLPQSVQELSVSFSPGLCDAELASLGGLSHCRRVELLACHSFTGVGFSSWTGLSQLTSLTISGCSGLTDAGLSALAHALGPPQQQEQEQQQEQGQQDQQQSQVLRELSLPGCRGITDKATCLAALTGLTRLNLSSNKGLTDRCLSLLFPSLCQLRALSLSMCGGLGDEGLMHLATAPRLQTLDLHCCWRLTDKGMHHLLSTSGSLMHVHIDGCPRLSLASCPPDFVALDALSGGGRLTTASSPHKSPGLLVRMPTQKSDSVVVQ